MLEDGGAAESAAADTGRSHVVTRRQEEVELNSTLCKLVKKKKNGIKKRRAHALTFCSGGKLPLTLVPITPCLSMSKMCEKLVVADCSPPEDYNVSLLIYGDISNRNKSWREVYAGHGDR